MKSVSIKNDLFYAYERSYAIYSSSFREYLIGENEIRGDEELIISDLVLDATPMWGEYDNCTFIDNKFNEADLSQAKFKSCTFLSNDFLNSTTLEKSIVYNNLFHLNKFYKAKVMDRGYFSTSKSTLNPYDLNGKAVTGGQNQQNVELVTPDAPDAISNNRGITEAILPTAVCTALNIFSYTTGCNPAQQLDGILLQSNEWLQNNKDNLTQYGYLAGFTSVTMLFGTIYSCTSMLHSALSLIVGTIPPSITTPLSTIHFVAGLYLAHQAGTAIKNIPTNTSNALAHSISSTQNFGDLTPTTRDKISSSISSTALAYLKSEEYMLVGTSSTDSSVVIELEEPDGRLLAPSTASSDFENEDYDTLDEIYGRAIIPSPTTTTFIGTLISRMSTRNQGSPNEISRTIH